MKRPIRERLGKLFSMLGSDNPGERENARKIIDEILRKNRKTWNDLTELLQTGSDASSWADDEEEPAAPIDATNIPDPKLPDELRNRPADNWRVLVAIADSFGRAWGARARKAAIDFSRAYRDEDAAVTLLNDIRAIFDALGRDRLSSAKLVEELVAMEDAGWADWRGLRDDQQSRELSQGELARLLAPFGIRPRSIWPRQRNQDSRSRKAYLRAQFERAWRAYCDSPGTPAQPNKFARLHRE